MIENKDYLSLFDDNERLTRSELSQIIEDELKKDEKDMDTQLVENCIDAITALRKEEKKKVTANGLRITLKRCIVAAVTIILFAVALLVSVLLIKTELTYKYRVWYPEYPNNPSNNYSEEDYRSSVTEGESKKCKKKENEALLCELFLDEHAAYKSEQNEILITV